VSVPQGEGFALRPWRSDDLDALVQHANDERVSRGLSDRFPFPYTRDDGQRFLAGQAVDLGASVFAIEVAGQACGGVGIRPGHGERSHGADLGYWLGHACWGQGLMTRVLAAYVPWVMQAGRLTRLQASVLDASVASARVLLKSGFAEEGRLHAAVNKRGQLHDLRVFARLEGLQP